MMCLGWSQLPFTILLIYHVIRLKLIMEEVKHVSVLNVMNHTSSTSSRIYFTGRSHCDSLVIKSVKTRNI